jgi:hypothetical protein
MRRSESGMWQAGTSKVVGPSVSVKDRWVGPVSKYWAYRSHAGDMDPLRLVVCHQWVLDLSALLHWRGWERKWSGSRGPLSRAERWSQEHFFSRVVHLSNFVGDLAKCCYTWTTWDTYGRGSYVDQAWKACDVLIGFSLQGVHRFESLWLSDMSNHLSRGSLHIVN